MQFPRLTMDRAAPFFTTPNADINPEKGPAKPQPESQPRKPAPKKDEPRPAGGQPSIFDRVRHAGNRARDKATEVIGTAAELGRAVIAQLQGAVESLVDRVLH